MALPPDHPLDKVAHLMRRFFTKVDKRNRSAMTGFLLDHFTYSTMNSWNRSYAIANKMKVHSVDLPKRVMDVAYEAVGESEMYEDLQYVLDDFSARHNHDIILGFNGRSGGYLVAYNCGVRDMGYESQCRGCGALSKRAVEAGNPFGICARCGKPQMSPLKKRVLQYYAGGGPGLGPWERGDLDDMDVATVRNLVETVQDFDKTCDEYVDAFIQWCDDNRDMLLKKEDVG